MRSAAAAFFLAAYSLFNPVRAHSHSHSSSKAAGNDVCAIDPKAIVSDACASFATLDDLNNAVQPSLDALTTATDFFSYYRLNLYNSECPFWNDESSMCGNIACAVNTIEKEQDIPLIWRVEELSKLEGPKARHPSRQMQQERESRPLMGELGDDVGESCVVEYDDECDERDYCVPEDESATAKGDYVSLVDNPERFTGYSGPGAHQVWEAIYRENCFPTETSAPSPSSSISPFVFGAAAGGQGLQSLALEQARQQPFGQAPALGGGDESMQLDDQCLEKRTFYRIISGMHASIASHLCWDYLNQTTGEWGPNLQCYQDRLHSHPDRISNLYFNFALVLRAVAKARSAFTDYTFCSGDLPQDRDTKQKVLALADNIASRPQIYNETLMFHDPALKEDFRNRFRNVSRTMDCVGCDKCRLWGKLQTAGYGTALKILFEFSDDQPFDSQLLRRTEVVALINTLGKISHAISAVGKFHKMVDQQNYLSHDASFPEYEQHGDGFEDMPRSDRQRQANSITDDFWRELSLIWRMSKWVVEGWIQFPSTVFKICISEFAKLWSYWLGIKVPEGRSWEFRKPPSISKEEL